MKTLTPDEIDAVITTAEAAWTEPAHALELGRKAVEAAVAQGCSQRLARALLCRADAYYFGGQQDGLAKAEEDAIHALALSQKRKDRAAVCAALTRLIRVTRARADVRASSVYAQQQLSVAQKLHKESAAVLLLAEALNNVGVVHLQVGDYAAADEYFTKGLRLVQANPESQIERMEAVLLGNQACLHAASGHHAEAAAVFTEVARRHGKRGNATAQIRALGNFAESALLIGKWDEAEAACHEARAVIEASGCYLTEPNICLVQAKLLRLQNRLAEAEVPLAAGLARAKTQGERRHFILLCAERGLLHAAGGRPAEGIAALNEALAATVERELRTDTRDLYGHLAAVAEASGDFATALRCLKEQVRLSEELNNAAAQQRLAVSRAMLKVERAERDTRQAKREAERLRQHQKSLQEMNQALREANEALAKTSADKEALLSRLHDQTQRFSELADRDPLTHLHNRRYLTRRLTELWAIYPQTGSELAIAVIDLDNFKLVNDNHSHEMGDVVLCLAARILEETLRPQDILARFGGEEFVVVLAGLSQSVAHRCCERLRAALANYAWHEIHSNLVVTASIGMAHSGEPDALTTREARPGLIHKGGTPERLLGLADERLYVAKTTGKDRVVIASDAAALPEGPRPKV